MEDLSGALGFAEKRTSLRPQYLAVADAVSQAITENLMGPGTAAKEQLEAQRKNTEPSPPLAPAPEVPPPSDVGATSPIEQRTGRLAARRRAHNGAVGSGADPCRNWIVYLAAPAAINSSPLGTHGGRPIPQRRLHG